MPNQLIATLPKQYVIASNAHSSVAPHISSQYLYQKKKQYLSKKKKLEVAATKKRHAEVLGDKLQPPPAPLLRTRFMIGKEAKILIAEYFDQHWDEPAKNPDNKWCTKCWQHLVHDGVITAHHTLDGLRSFWRQEYKPKKFAAASNTPRNS